MRTETKRRDVPGMIAAVVFIVLGLWVFQQTLSMTPLGAVFPRTIAVALIVFSFALLIVNLRRSGSTRAPDEAALSGSPESTPRRLLLITTMAGWVLLMPVVGFLVSTGLAFLCILAIANYDGWPLRRTVGYIVASAAIVILFYLLLTEVLLVPVPRGFLA